ncbi:glycoside hydrolase family 1 protein [Xylariomycetidae sp. FL2044]|nr:glycoside hydrolase family 1 protein [Xylariomycetidae sp. FL2044]
MSLPSDFLWGFATAAYQVEGAVNQDGRGMSIWDTFCATEGKIAGGENGETACDSYNRTADDIDLLKKVGAKAYRFSLSWVRIIPLGGRDDPINQAGIDHYVKFVDDLLEAGIVPLVTLLHWDVPDELHKRYGGLLNRQEFPLDFENYARVVYKALPKVKHWITFNEPWCSSILGYSTGYFAPGHTSDRSKSPVGDSSREPWIVGHNLLVAHGRAVKVYRDEFKPTDKGQIGITLNGDFTYPWDPEDPRDVEACDRKIEFAISWFADPVYFGEYPASMRKQLGDRLPEFTDEERALVKGSNDFYGMNHYTADYVKHGDGNPAPEDFLGDLTTHAYNKNGDCIGPETQSFWLRPNPEGFRGLINWLSKRYGYPDIYVTENGTSIKGENELDENAILNDKFRVDYFRGYVNAMAKAVSEDGCKVKGYMAWSLMDNFEWAEGYETRFGVAHVNYDKDQIRTPKKSGTEMQIIFNEVMGL